VFSWFSTPPILKPTTGRHWSPPLTAWRKVSSGFRLVFAVNFKLRKYTKTIEYAFSAVFANRADLAAEVSAHFLVCIVQVFAAAAAFKD
jgi:hypothetical protein